MVGKKKLSCLMAFLVSLSFLGGCKNIGASQSQKTLKDKKIINIGISQFVEHPALESARKGFMDALKSKGYEENKNIKVDFQNAQGDMATTQTIAQNFASKNEDLIFAIATPCAQSAFNVIKEKPILITAVTDPVQSGLVKSLEVPSTNVTGTSDSVSIDKQLQLIKDIIPRAKTIGVVYNTSEKNSELQVKDIKKAAEKFGFNIKTSGVTNVNEVAQSLNSIVGKIDVLYVPTDNTIVSSMPLVVNECYKRNIPIIGAESAHVKAGAVAANGIDYYKLGFQTGIMAVDIINGKNVEEMSIQTSKDTSTVINKDACEKLNISIPKELEEKAQIVTGGVH
ncbi:ABC transporter substrate-binding protein [Haloimpatiens lingqiaonensis]|uniref:ABC transporter substrate-binding protein n=1 Tax=Haloimpatiens lingqiaonensis TaxID=1380675 RepID=UPI0010FDE39F|nr:ABC transporter substrate-binding protein [Haloimpatiens lingqiaonensis]